MTTQAEYVSQAVSKRSQMYDAIKKATEQAIDELVPQFMEDFKHQRFVRGISRDPSIREVDEHIDKCCEGIAFEIKQRVWLALDAQGLLYDGL